MNNDDIRNTILLYNATLEYNAILLFEWFIYL